MHIELGEFELYFLLSVQTKKAILKEYKLRKITEADRLVILPWRNAPQTRQFMYTSQKIGVEEHSAWFRKMMVDDTCEYFIFEVNQLPSAVCALTHIHDEQNISNWAAYMAPEAPPGIGAFMEFYLLDYAFSERKFRKIWCEVLASNASVLSLHKSFGFKTEGIFVEQHFNGQDYIDIHRLGFFAKQWPEIRKKYIKLLKIDG